MGLAKKMCFLLFSIEPELQLIEGAILLPPEERLSENAAKMKAEEKEMEP